jgi:hypothetical protein
MMAEAGHSIALVAHEARARSCEQPVYDEAVAEFDRLWETGASRLQPERMKELLIVIEAFENASREDSLKGIRHATRNP